MDKLPKIYWREVSPEDTELLQSRLYNQGNGSAETLADLPGGELQKLKLQPLNPEDSNQPSNFGTVVLPSSPVLETWPALSEKLGQGPGLVPCEIREKNLSIHEIECRNLTNDPVFFPAGTIFLGGAQNRVLTDSVLAPPGNSELPTLCVEQGRWDEGRQFFGLSRLPDLLSQHVLLNAKNTRESIQDRQLHAWQLIRESLTLQDAINPTLDLNAWSHAADLNIDSAAFTQDERGVFSLDERTGLSTLQVFPNAGFMGKGLRDLKQELSWRQLLRRKISGARQCFRIFDEQRRLAILCSPDGKTLRDLSQQNILFEYEENDLQNSFHPPLERLPDTVEVCVAARPGFSDTQQFKQALRECRVVYEEPDGPLQSFRFWHAELPCVGRGLLYEKSLAHLYACAAWMSQHSN